MELGAQKWLDYLFLRYGINVGDCGKTGRGNGAMECSNIGARKGMYDAVKLEKGEKSRAVRSYADVTREDVQTPLGQNRLIIPEFIYFIMVYFHW